MIECCSSKGEIFRGFFAGRKNHELFFSVVTIVSEFVVKVCGISAHATTIVGEGRRRSLSTQNYSRSYFQMYIQTSSFITVNNIHLCRNQYRYGTSVRISNFPTRRARSLEGAIVVSTLQASVATAVPMESEPRSKIVQGILSRPRD